MTAPAKSPRPRRAGKSDRMFYPKTSIDEVRCDMMLAPFDKAHGDMDDKWGIDRLVELVSIETAEKWGAAMAKLNDAIRSCNVEETKARVGVCVRGLAAMDAEATANGHKPKSPEVWEAEFEGRIFSVIKDVCDWRKAEIPEGRRVYSMHEVAVALNALDRGVFAEIKDAIPEAKLAGLKKAEPAPLYNDELPF